MLSLLLWPLKLLLFLPVLASCLLTLTALSGEEGWLWSLTQHFRVQYLAIQTLALAATGFGYWLGRRQGRIQPVKWVSMVILLFFAGLNLLAVAPYYLPQHRPDGQAAPGQRLRLMHINLYAKRNQEPQRVAAAIREADPDVLLLVEYLSPWQRRLETGVLQRYPHRVTVRGHLGLYSKRPFEETERFRSGEDRRVVNQANLRAVIRLNGKPLTIVGVHPASPYRPAHLEWHRQSVETWLRRRPQWGRHVILLGDLNTTPWSREFASLTGRAGLRDSQLGYGLQPSWPVFLPLPHQPAEAQQPSLWLSLLGIPIDHVLVSDGIAVLSRRTGPFTGSDHLPVIVDIALKPAP